MPITIKYSNSQMPLRPAHPKELKCMGVVLTASPVSKVITIKIAKPI
ncbi:MAG: hypothetical protein ACI80S_001669 [Pseudohongiellaceae bacterium]|jgi:hypothetical protein